MDSASSMTAASPSARRIPTALRVLATLVVAGVLLAGAILVVGQLLPGNVWVKIGLSVVWFVAAGAVLRRIAEATSADLVKPFKLAGLLAGVLLVGWYGASFLGNDVQEKLVTVQPETPRPPEMANGSEPLEATNGPVLLGRGTIRGIDHTASGTAELVDTGKGVVVQLRKFKVQPGPDYRLYLANGESPDGARELGALKGTSGNQRYELERRSDARRYKNVLVWCRAFSVPVAKAALR
jgi:electron transfer DM13